MTEICIGDVMFFCAHFEFLLKAHNMLSKKQASIINRLEMRVFQNTFRKRSTKQINKLRRVCRAAPGKTSGSAKQG